jgi:hypothetical protein
MESIFPEFNLGLVDNLKDKAKKIGRFLFHTPEAPLYVSNHYEKSHFEPTDGEAHQPELPYDLQEGTVELVTVDMERVKDLIMQARIAREAKES